MHVFHKRPSYSNAILKALNPKTLHFITKVKGISNCKIEIFEDLINHGITISDLKGEKQYLDLLIRTKDCLKKINEKLRQGAHPLPLNAVKNIYKISIF